MAANSGNANLGFLNGGGEMGEHIRRFDWAKTPLGPPESWSPALRTTLRIMLANRFPHVLWWGPDYIQFYNDPYRPIPGAKHPDKVLGRPASECWAEIWHVIGPLIDRPFKGGPATWDEDIFLEINRHGFLEESHFTIAYSPVPDDTVPSGIGGVLATVHEITQKVVAERRVVALRDLGARVSESKTAEEACAMAAKTLTAHSRDVPFVLLYLLENDREHARLAGAAGLSMGAEISPFTVDLRQSHSGGWPLSKALQSGTMQVVEQLGRRFATIPAGPWSNPPGLAIVAPIPSNNVREPAGLIVAGVSARLKFDEFYRDFFDLVRTQVASAIANARAHEEEKKRAEALAEIDRAKTTFFSNVSHEFRTPLTLMLAPVEDLLSRSQTDLSPAATRQLQLVNRNGFRLLRLVNTLLDFSRIEAGRALASFQPTDLAAFTSELASVFRSATERAGLRLLVDCPPLREPVFVDRNVWEKIVLNLISNAFKFTFEGEIEVALREINSTAELRIRDTGVGIPPGEMPRLFERFHRVQTTRSRTHEGSGIGLALVQELVKLHGGTVHAESVPDQGTTFVVSIPLGRDHLPQERIVAERALGSTAMGAVPFVEEALRWLPDEAEPRNSRDIFPEPQLVPVPCPAGIDRPRVIVADDNADMRQYLARLLSERYEVVAVSDGETALAATRERHPDLVLSDVMMPRLDGFGLLKELRACHATRTIPIILLSARAGEESRVEGLDLGADDYIVKPFSAREVLARVETHLKLARLRRESEERTAADLEAMTRLHEVGLVCARAGNESTRCLDEILDAAIFITGAEKGNIQLLEDSEPGALRIEAQRGFDGAFLKFFERVRQDGSCACGAAMRSGERVIIEDVAQSGIVSDKGFLGALKKAGVAAVQSSPLVSSSGRLLGIISTHFGQPRRFAERELRLLDLLARQAADYLERKLMEACLAAELADIKLLQGVSAQMIREENVEALYEKILDAAVAIMRPDFASLQQLFPDRAEGGELLLLAQRGFPPESVAAWKWVRTDTGCTCGEALRTGRRALAPDVETCPYIAGRPGLAAFRHMGVRTGQSTPLISRRGIVLGMISTHWREPHTPSERDWRLLDIVARQAADLIAQRQFEEALRQRTAQFETLLNQAPLGVYLVDADFRLRQVNPAAQPAFGHIPDLIGRDFDEVIHILWEKPYADEVARIFRHTLETGEPFSTQERTEQRLDHGVAESYEWRIDRIALPDLRFGVVCYFRSMSTKFGSTKGLKRSTRNVQRATFKS